MPVNPNPPAAPIKVTSGYHATQALPSVEPAKLEPAAFPTSALPKSIGYIKDVGNMNTGKAAALDAADAARTFRASGSVEQAVVAASLLASRATGGSHHVEADGKTASYAVLRAGDDLYVTPLWFKNGLPGGTRLGFDVDWSDTSGANEGRGTASKATDASYLAAVGATRWLDVREGA
jgi:hypothetical protein